MREVKFRAWEPEDNEWVYFTLDELVDAIALGDTSSLPIGNKLLKKKCQYTGLKDSKGKEIYEGDIVKVNTTKIVKGELLGKVIIGKVLWKNAGFTVEVDDEIKDYSLLYPYPSQGISWEIIGNIYENQELLNP